MRKESWKDEMRLLITGASGLLGLNLALHALHRHTVIGVDRARLGGVPFELIKADLLEPDAVGRILDQARPDAIVHCAALADLEACESDPALAGRLNADLPGVLGAAAARRGVRLVHISTDAVFDGTKDGPYSEDDRPNPLSVYARTKLEGEQAVLAAHPDAIVARVNFYGWSLSGRRSLAEFFVYNLRAGRTVRGFTDVWFCPTFVGDLGDLLLHMVEEGLRGLYHAVGAEAMSKYEFGVRLARRFGLDEGLIRPTLIRDSELSAPRAHNLRLSVHKLSTALHSPLPDFSTGLDRFYEQERQGYPQKIASYAQV